MYLNRNHAFCPLLYKYTKKRGENPILPHRQRPGCAPLTLACRSVRSGKPGCGPIHTGLPTRPPPTVLPSAPCGESVRSMRRTGKERSSRSATRPVPRRKTPPFASMEAGKQKIPACAFSGFKPPFLRKQLSHNTINRFLHNRFPSDMCCARIRASPS